MCPLRIILVFLSGIVAGYFAWRSFRCKMDEDSENPRQINDNADSAPEKLGLSRRINGVVLSGFWGFVDMASGRYLWQSLVSNTHKSTEGS